jgi:hypothetical protein
MSDDQNQNQSAPQSPPVQPPAQPDPAQRPAVPAGPPNEFIRSDDPRPTFKED